MVVPTGDAVASPTSSRPLPILLGHVAFALISERRPRTWRLQTRCPFEVAPLPLSAESASPGNDKCPKPRGINRSRSPAEVGPDLHQNTPQPPSRRPRRPNRCGTLSCSGESLALNRQVTQCCDPRVPCRATNATRCNAIAKIGSFVAALWVVVPLGGTDPPLVPAKQLIIEPLGLCSSQPGALASGGTPGSCSAGHRRYKMLRDATSGAT
jgi:hypothetical protein